MKTLEEMTLREIYYLEIRKAFAFEVAVLPEEITMLREFLALLKESVTDDGLTYRYKLNEKYILGVFFGDDGILDTVCWYRQSTGEYIKFLEEK